MLATPINFFYRYEILNYEFTKSYRESKKSRTFFTPPLGPGRVNVLIDKLLQTIESELGPVVFPKVTVIAYADDIALISNHAFGPALMNKAAYMLEIASNILGLKVNVSKTKAMAWNHSHFLPDFCFKIYNKPVEWVRQFKYLGVIFDDQLSFTQHSKYIAKLAQKRINILKHMAGSPYGATQGSRTLFQALYNLYKFDKSRQPQLDTRHVATIFTFSEEGYL